MKIMNVTTLGEARVESPLAFACADRVVVPAEVQWLDGKVPTDMMLFEKSGPTKKLFFEPSKALAAIVTCGGL